MLLANSFFFFLLKPRKAKKSSARTVYFLSFKRDGGKTRVDLDLILVRRGVTEED